MTMATRADVEGDSDEDYDLIDDEIHITDSGALIQVANNDNAGVTMASNESHRDDRLALAELAAELLRLQEQCVEPRRTGAFSPETLRRWTNAPYESPCTPGGTASSLPAPATPSRDPTTPLDSLPTSSSTSDGRSDAADILRSSIHQMQSKKESIGIGTESRIADFTGEGMPSDYTELQRKKAEAEATAALLTAELVALRGKYEEERRQLIKTTKDLRRRNEELESLLSLHRVGGAEMPNGRSASRSSHLPEDEEREGENKFGFRMRALAQRFTSPHPRGSQSSITAEVVEEARQQARRQPDTLTPGPGSCSSTINTNEDFGPLDISDKEAQPTISDSDESKKVIAILEEKLRQSEHRAEVLEQRLLIVKESGDAVIQSLNEELADVAEDRAKSETAMIKELANLDSQRRAERNEYEKRIQEWIAHDANRKMEVEEYETRIASLLDTVRMMSADEADGHMSAVSSSWDNEAEQEMFRDLTDYIDLLGNASKGSKGSSKRGSLVMSINDAFDLEFNANPIYADKMIEYYRSKAELKDFTLKSELPRMDYEVLVLDQETGKDVKLVSTDEIRSYFASLDADESSNDDPEIELIIRAANQSLLADPLAILTGEGVGKLVHSGSFHSTVIATVCLFKLDLRREGERRIKVQCELAVCVPRGESNDETEASGNDNKDEKSSATLELARANLLIQFSPSPTSTPSGPLMKYSLMDIKPTIRTYEEGSDNARAIHSAAAVLARDRHSSIQSGGSGVDARPNVKDRFLSRVKQFSSNRSSASSE